MSGLQKRRPLPVSRRPQGSTAPAKDKLRPPYFVRLPRQMRSGERLRLLSASDWGAYRPSARFGRRADGRNPTAAVPLVIDEPETSAGVSAVFVRSTAFRQAMAVVVPGSCWPGPCCWRHGPGVPALRLRIRTVLGCRNLRGRSCTDPDVVAGRTCRRPARRIAPTNPTRSNRRTYQRGLSRKKAGPPVGGPAWRIT
jgi:hypothetical protein